MTVVGRALMAGPKVLLLDEPSMGLAPMLIKEIFDIIQVLHKEQKLSILLVEQNVKLALATASHAYVMEGGQEELPCHKALQAQEALAGLKPA